MEKGEIREHSKEKYIFTKIREIHFHKKIKENGLQNKKIHTVVQI